MSQHLNTLKSAIETMAGVLSGFFFDTEKNNLVAEKQL